MSGNGYPRMLFIVGRGRSGTTVLGSYLNALPGFSVAPECLFTMNLHNQYLARDFTPDVMRQFGLDIQLEDRIRNWAFNPSQLAHYLVERHHEGMGFADACRLVYVAHADYSGVPEPSVTVDKNPHYSLFVRELARLFPDALFLHVVRDPRANVASYRKVRFDSSDTGVLAARWRIYNDAILEAKPGLGERYMLLRFEDFLRDPVKALERVNSFMGCAPIEMSGTEPASKPVGGARKKAWHSRLNRSLDPAVNEEWREQLWPGQARMVETICGPLMEQFGYEKSQCAASPNAPNVIIARARGRASVAAERALFRMPLRTRARLIAIYRKLTGTA